AERAVAARPLPISPRALERRATRGLIRGVVASDLPVHPAYVRALTARGARLRGTSRWLDAASIEVSAALAVELTKLPFVAHIERVPVGMPLRPVDTPTGAGP